METAHPVSQPLLISIACWTLCRYGEWLVGGGASLLPSCVEALLLAMKSRNKKVQEGSQTALSPLVELAAEPMWKEFGSHMLPTFVAAFGHYQVRNRCLLYDLIATLAEGIGEQFSDGCRQVLSFFLARWKDGNTLAQERVILLENLIPLATSCPAVALERFGDIYPLLCANLEHSLRDLSQGNMATDYDRAELINCLYFLGTMLGVLGPARAPQVVQQHQSEPGMPTVLAYARQSIDDANAQVRSMTYALLGEIAVNCPVPGMLDFIPQLTAGLNHIHLNACNNAGWALLKIAVFLADRADGGLVVRLTGPVTAALDKLCSVMMMPVVPMLREMMAKAVACFGLSYPVCGGGGMDGWMDEWKWIDRLGPLSLWVVPLPSILPVPPHLPLITSLLHHPSPLPSTLYHPITPHIHPSNKYPFVCPPSSPPFVSC